MFDEGKVLKHPDHGQGRIHGRDDLVLKAFSFNCVGGFCETVGSDDFEARSTECKIQVGRFLPRLVGQKLGNEDIDL